MEYPLERRQSVLVMEEHEEKLLRVPAPPHRHAAPSGPWPWQDLDDNIPTSASTETCSTQTRKDSGAPQWVDYPECLFPNWKEDQVARSKMKTILAKSKESVIYHVDVATDGQFSNQGRHLVRDEEQFNQVMADTKPAEHLRLRVFLVDNLSLPVMQMLGTKYNVEPFFWTSSVNWIPARYQENVLPLQGDHITITLKFPRAVRPENSTFGGTNLQIGGKIDTQLPLPLLYPNTSEHSKRNRVVILDFLALHMVRTHPESSTIISYHPHPEWKTTTAENLHSRVYLAGQSVYWQNIFKKDNDPTFVLLATMWYALYAWDEACETLWEYICQLEMNVIDSGNINVTQELHKIRAHLLQYASLLEDFKQSVLFVQETPNPVMTNDTNNVEDTASRTLMKKECQNLLTQIDRLKLSREMWDKRLQNIMNLGFSSVNIQDSKQMQDLTRATVRDSAAMKQIAYLTMVFFPATFSAGVFGMNVEEINPGTLGTLPHYFATTIPLTLATTWIIVAFQGKWGEEESEDASIWARVFWPIVLVRRMRKNMMSPKAASTRTPRPLA